MKKSTAKKSLDKLNDPVCRGCVNRESCWMTKMLVIGCEHKEESE